VYILLFVHQQLQTWLQCANLKFHTKNLAKTTAINPSQKWIKKINELIHMIPTTINLNKRKVAFKKSVPNCSLV
jgi:hypothetical protein